jgi:hypothetical protein
VADRPKENVVRYRTVVVVVAVVLLFVGVAVVRAQQKAAIQMNQQSGIHGGSTLTFTVKLDEPVPEGSHFDLRISPVSADEEIDLGAGTPVDRSNTLFRVTGNLPQNALPGEWHISTMWFFLPGAGWTHKSLSTNDLRFHVEGPTYPIPTKAEVALER